mmetsp:Transcript_16695/g.32415  ORF Transcript_16695/g.32415 Transcript_16695/m.32415 type:complete len:177 (-) Transcript_16695:595-1125(-)
MPLIFPTKPSARRVSSFARSLAKSILSLRSDSTSSRTLTGTSRKIAVDDPFATLIDEGKLDPAFSTVRDLLSLSRCSSFSSILKYHVALKQRFCPSEFGSKISPNAPRHVSYYQRFHNTNTDAFMLSSRLPTAAGNGSSRYCLLSCKACPPLRFASSDMVSAQLWKLEAFASLEVG